jgi:tRNA(Ser,Leu) C12 N-acetylase TAN1
LKAKAMEFCLERYQDLHISSFASLESDCVKKIYESLLSQTTEKRTSSFQDILERTKQREEKIKQDKEKEQQFSVENIVKIPGTVNNYKVLF